MTTISLDGIVKNILLKRRYGLQYYLDFLISAKDCLRELNFDMPLNTVRYKVCVLNSNHAIELPDDYVDFVGVYVRNGQYFTPLVEDNSLNLIPNYDAEFNIQPYGDGIAVSSDTNNPVVGFTAGYWWMVNWNALGENIGRMFGGVGLLSDTFRENKARNEIKINENLLETEYVLGYIGNGLNSDSASRINAYAQAAIEAYCMWQFKENNRTYGANEAQVAKADYEQQVQILRARLSDLTLDKFKRIVQSNSIGVKY